MRTPSAHRALALFLIAIFVIAVVLLVGSSGQAAASTNTPDSTVGGPEAGTPTATPTTCPVGGAVLPTNTPNPNYAACNPAVDASAYFRPEAGSPPNGGTIQVGTRIDLDLMIHSGQYNVTGQQSYVTFDATRLQAVNASQPGCVLTSTVIADPAIFDATLQNEICNGPANCDFRGVTYTPGQWSFASGALGNPSYHGPDFRVAHAAFCAVASGTAVIRWDFSPPAPIARDSEVVDENSITVDNPNCYVDYIINIVCSPVTPGPTYTSTPTFTATPTPPALSPTPCAMGFTDVYVTDYFYDAVRYLYCEGAISGYSDGSFRPYNNTTRGQLSKIITLAEGWTIDTSGGPHFSDVPAGSTFYSYVETAYHHGVISGYSDGTFKPGNNVTRGQLSKIVVAAQGWQPICPSVPTFSDVPPSNPFYCYIEAAYCHGIISGYSDGTFKWGNNATRGQISKIVYEAKVGGHACGSR